MTTPTTPTTPPPPQWEPPKGPGSPGVHPVQLSVAHSESYSRGLAVLGIPLLYGRAIALIPVNFFILVVGIFAFLAAWILQFAVVLTGEYPEGGHSFLTGYLQLSFRSSAWALGLTDKYPGFSLKPGPQVGGAPLPVELSVVRAEKYSRGLAVLGVPLLYGRHIALIPVYVVLLVLAIASFFTAWISQFAVLFTGRYPEGAHRFITGYLRLTARAQAWLFGLTDKYPGFATKP